MITYVWLLYCQAQPQSQIQLSWAELALVSTKNLNHHQSGILAAKVPRILGGNSDHWSSCKWIHIMDCKISSLLFLISKFLSPTKTSTVSPPSQLSGTLIWTKTKTPCCILICNCDVVIFIIILAYYPKPLHFRSDTFPLPQMCLCNTWTLNYQKSRITSLIVSCRILGQSFDGEKYLARKRKILSHPTVSKDSRLSSPSFVKNFILHILVCKQNAPIPYQNIELLLYSCCSLLCL